MHMAIAVMVTALVFYPLGILTAKYVIADTVEIKLHVSGEIEKLRSEVSAALSKIITKL